MSAPSAEWDAARPALTAIAQSVRLTLPKQPVADAPALLKFEPFREAKEQAFVGELPGDWKKELTASIMAGANPYVRAGAVGRSADNLFSYLHYKLASFQLPVAELNSTGAGFRPYQPGAQALEKYLFPAVAQRSGQDFSQWKITRAGGLQSLFSHGSGVRFDGEAVDYAYRYKGEAFTGQAYVVTYFLPGTPTATWFLYALFGFEAPAGREDAARAATLRLLKSFAFEGRYAPQADLFWTLARDAGLKALAGAPEADAASIARTSPAAAPSAVEAAALALTEVKETSSAKPVPVQAGIVAATQGAQAIGGDLLGDLRESP